MRKISVYMLIIVVLGLITYGCGNQNNSVKAPQFIPVENQPKSEQLIKFNAQVKQISGESSAAAAINTFTAYAQSRISGHSDYKKSGKVFALSGDILAKLARIEAHKRGFAVDNLSAAEANTEINPTRIAETLNELSNEPENCIIVPSGIAAVQSEVRQQLPDIAADEDSQEMTPLEAMVIGYVVCTGDDGSAQPESLNFNVDTEQVSGYMDKMVE